MKVFTIIFLFLIGYVTDPRKKIDSYEFYRHEAAEEYTLFDHTLDSKYGNIFIKIYHINNHQ